MVCSTLTREIPPVKVDNQKQNVTDSATQLSSSAAPMSDMHDNEDKKVCAGAPSLSPRVGAAEELYLSFRTSRESRDPFSRVNQLTYERSTFLQWGCNRMGYVVAIHGYDYLIPDNLNVGYLTCIQNTDFIFRYTRIHSIIMPTGALMTCLDGEYFDTVLCGREGIEVLPEPCELYEFLRDCANMLFEDDDFYPVPAKPKLVSDKRPKQFKAMRDMLVEDMTLQEVNEYLDGLVTHETQTELHEQSRTRKCLRRLKSKARRLRKHNSAQYARRKLHKHSESVASDDASVLSHIDIPDDITFHTAHTTYAGGPYFEVLRSFRSF
jgi:hypothetical protein